MSNFSVYFVYAVAFAALVFKGEPTNTAISEAKRVARSAREI